jgi:hypothetical protein
MSFMDTIKEKLGMSKDRAADVAHQHGDKIDQGLDKAGHTVDSKTGGKHSSQIDSGVGKAQDAVKDFGEKGENGERGHGGS